MDESLVRTECNDGFTENVYAACGHCKMIRQSGKAVIFMKLFGVSNRKECLCSHG